MKKRSRENFLIYILPVAAAVQLAKAALLYTTPISVAPFVEVAFVLINYLMMALIIVAVFILIRRGPDDSLQSVELQNPPEEEGAVRDGQETSSEQN